jgi:hypothetical protein
MAGVTTAVVAFIFLCLAIPSLIQHKNQYYVAFLSIIGVIFFDAVGHMIPVSAGASPVAVCYVLVALGQIIAIVMLFLATGGLTFRALRGDMIEVLRRDGEKEVIVPLSEEAKQKIRAAQEAAGRRAKQDETEPKVFTIDNPAPRTAPSSHPAPSHAAPSHPAPPPRPMPPKTPPSTDPLPLE